MLLDGKLGWFSSAVHLVNRGNHLSCMLGLPLAPDCFQQFVRNSWPADKSLPVVDTQFDPDIKTVDRRRGAQKLLVNE